MAALWEIRAPAVVAVGLAGVLLLALCAAAVAAPAWSIGSLADSTVAPGGTLEYLVESRNSGDVATDGSQIDVVARLPVGMTAVSARLLEVATGAVHACFDGRDGRSPVVGASGVVCPSRDVVPARAGDHSLEKMSLTVRADPSATGVLTAAFGISGGGAAASASTVDPTRVSAFPPGFGIDAFDALVSDVGGDPLSQAGGHPAVTSVSIDLNTLTNPTPLFGSLWPVEPVKDVSTDLAPGFVGNATVADRCSLPQLVGNPGGAFDPRPLCPATSQVGTTSIRIKGARLGLDGPDSLTLPLYNLVPPPGVPAAFGFNVLGSVVVLEAEVRSDGDYGISVNAVNLPEALAIVGTTVTFWGVPADPSHDAERACPGDEPPSNGGPSCVSGAPLRAFLRLPTACSAPGGGLSMRARVDSWMHPGDFQQATWFGHEPPGYPYAPEDWGPRVGITGCDRVPFDPSFTAQPQPAQAASPVGLNVDIALPQSDDPSLPASESDLKSATVTLPGGMHVNPSSANGLQGCSPTQIALNQSTQPACPDASAIGTVAIDTPLLHDPLTGQIFLARPFENPSHSLIAVYLSASADGVVIKLPGAATLDPRTGQITTTFDNNPQLPFSRLHLELDGGPVASLALPGRCGTYTTHATLTGWNGRTVERDSSFTVSQDANGQPCPATFSPGFRAGTRSNRAGSSSSFLLRVTRGDVDQELGALTVQLPGGLIGRIARVPLCPDAQAAAGTCSESSRIGDATVGAGAGSNPFFITAGRAYLTGPYKGGPFGVSIVVPAVAGPFDLGDVVVRSALFVDKHTSHVSIVSDPLPTILQGVPLEVRDVRVNVDRPGFFLNPTNCARKTIFGVVQSTAGAIAHVSDRFQAAECANLGFDPRMALSIGGRGHTASGSTTPFTTTLTMPSRDQANLRYVRVTLPGTLNARLTVISDACTRQQFEAEIAKCAHARAGAATAVTPLLAGPLRGSAYFVKNGHAIPDLFVALRGQVAFDLIGRITIVRSRYLRTTFATAPDVPIRSFTLHLFGDSTHRSIGVLTDLCSATARRAKARVDYVAQNGKVLNVALPFKVGGCPRRRPRPRTRR